MDKDLHRGGIDWEGLRPSMPPGADGLIDLLARAAAEGGDDPEPAIRRAIEAGIEEIRRRLAALTGGLEP